MNALVQWRADDSGQLKPWLAGSDVPIIWAPQPGSQEAFLECPITEALYEGERGPGKTDALLMSFAQHCGKGYGADWRGILFRRTFPELSDAIAKSLKWFSEIFPDATYNSSAHEWRWPGGETLRFRFADKADDYWQYHGHAYPWIGWEELTTWASSDVYQLMFSCLRSTNPNVPRQVRATTNPFGRGHNWVKKRFGLPVQRGRVVGPIIKTEGEPDRVAVHGTLSENKVLLHADPDYRDRIRASAKDPMRRKAWLGGSWDIVSGGMFDDLWDTRYHVLPSIPFSRIPKRWQIDRAFDDGSSKPFSVGWYAESNGEPFEFMGRLVGPVRGDLVRMQEWYGWNGTENQGLRMGSRDKARRILELQKGWSIESRCRPGPADTAIWTGAADDPSKSVASEMEAIGVEWTQADKSAGSREQGWKLVRERLEGAVPDADGRREDPGLFVTEDCVQFLRTIPTLPRDAKKPDDVDTDTEDHIADELRYRCRAPRAPLTGRDRMRAWSR